uniref:Putative secreted protein n=1 Tax=Ixodes ricinus TaxID=34613 RepID=A0A147BAD5_IXORI
MRGSKNEGAFFLWSSVALFFVLYLWTSNASAHKLPLCTPVSTSVPYVVVGWSTRSGRMTGHVTVPQTSLRHFMLPVRPKTHAADWPSVEQARAERTSTVSTFCAVPQPELQWGPKRAGCGVTRQKWRD